MIKWIFFDVGNVIVNDDPWMAVILERLYRAIAGNGHALSIHDFFEERRDLIVNQQDGRYWRTLGKKYLGEKGWDYLKKSLGDELEDNYLKYNIPFPGINGIIEKLSLTYQLAIAANQTVHCRQALEEIDLLKYFAVHGISEAMGLEKPSCDFFNALLEQAQCSPDEVIMIGDRIDNDIVPAKQLGMRTIRLRQELDQKGYQPQTDFEKAYFDNMAKTSLSCHDPQCKEDEPDITITSIDEIADAVYEIDNSSSHHTISTSVD